MVQAMDTVGIGAGPLHAWRTALRTPLALGLAALLGAQILVTIGLSAGGRGSLAPAALDSSLLDFDPKSVTAVRIEGASEGPVTLAKADKGWIVADLSDFPADGSKVEQLIERLAGLKRPLPLATSEQALKRHKVADTGYERKVSLESGEETVATLLLGDSPGFRRTFARPAGESAVYDLDLPTFDVSNRRDDWIGRDLLRVERESVERVSAADWTLSKGEKGWQLAGTDTAPEQTAVEALLSRIGALGYRGVLGIEDKPEYNLASPLVELKLGLAGGGGRTYRIAQIKDSQDYVLKADDKPWYFKLSEYDLEGIKDLSRAKLAGEKAQEGSPAAKAAPEGKSANGEEDGSGGAPQSNAPAPNEPTVAPAPAAPQEPAQSGPAE